MCIPQYDPNEDVIPHVKGSRAVYEKCPIIIVDKEQVCPGLLIPSREYMSRLWTTAEQSAMLVNPTVSRRSFIDFEMYNQNTIRTALSLNFGSNDRYSMVFGYTEETILAMETFDMGFIILYNIGQDYLFKTYPMLGRFFSSLFINGGAGLPGLPLFLPLDKQHDIILDYKTTKTNKVLDDFLAKYQNETLLPKGFDYKKYFEAFLCLYYDILEYELNKSWNKLCYQHVLVSLRQLPGDTDHWTEEAALKCFCVDDQALVKAMIEEQHNLTSNNISIDGITIAQAPMNHEMTVNYILKQDLKSILLKTTLQPHTAKIAVTFTYNDKGDMSTMIIFTSEFVRNDLAEQTATESKKQSTNIIMVANSDAAGNSSKRVGDRSAKDLKPGQYHFTVTVCYGSSYVFHFVVATVNSIKLSAITDLETSVLALCKNEKKLGSRAQGLQSKLEDIILKTDGLSDIDEFSHDF